MPDDAALTDDDYRALARFRYALRVFLRFSEQAAREAGITPAQHQLLLAIRGAYPDGAPSTGDLAEWLQQSHHAVVELIDRAAAADLVTRSIDTADARRRLITVSARGQAILDALTAAHRTELRRLQTDLQDLRT